MARATPSDGDHRVAQQEGAIAFAFASFGRRIGLSLCDASLLDAVRDNLPAGWQPVAPRDADRHFRLARHTAADSPVHRQGFHLYEGEEFKRWAPDRERAVEGIEAEVEHDIAEFADPWLFMHAGVVAWQGEAIVLPGASHAGKSTLTAALVDAGATYLSDEYAVLDADGRVLPFPRRLSLREGPLGPTGRLDLRHRAPAQHALAIPVPVGQLVLLTHRKNHDFRIDRCPRGIAMIELCQHMVAIRRRPHDVLATLNAMTRTAPVLKGVRGDAREAAHRLLSGDASGSGTNRDCVRRPVARD